MARKNFAGRENGSASCGRRSDRTGAAVGPCAAFAGAVVVGFAIWGVSAATLPPDSVVPVVATVFLALAAGLGPVAWAYRNMDPLQVTYSDVVGALTLIGVFAMAAIEPEQMVRLIESGHIGQLTAPLHPEFER